MASNNPGIREYQTSAAMWAYSVAIYHEQLREAVESYAQARHDGAIRNTILGAPKGRQYLFGDQLQKASKVMTIGTVWRMSMARYAFLCVSAQLRKCTIALSDRGIEVPLIRNQKLIRLLRDVDEHWEQVEDGRSLAELQALMPEEGPTRVVYTGKYIEIGGFDTREIAEWAAQVDAAVRAQLEEEGDPIAGIDESLQEFFKSHPVGDD